MERLEWLQWRRKGIGSSDAPIIMGTSKFSTILNLYEEKISEDEIIEEDRSFIMDLGNEAEPRIRNLFSFLKDKDFQPCLIESADFPFLRWSGDGLSGREGLEIKLAGKEIYEEAKSGKVSDCYFPQVHHGIMVGNLEKMHFVVYPMAEFKKDRNGPLNADLLAHVEVLPDKDYMAKLLEEELKFWDCVTKKKPPLASDKDYKSLQGQSKLLNKWKRLKVKSDKIEEELSAVREALIEEAKKQGHNRYLSSGVRLREESRKGTVAYAKIPAIKNMSEEELDSYRGKGSISWKIEMVED